MVRTPDTRFGFWVSAVVIGAALGLVQPGEAQELSVEPGPPPPDISVQPAAPPPDISVEPAPPPPEISVEPAPPPPEISVEPAPPPPDISVEPGTGLQPAAPAEVVQPAAPADLAQPAAPAEVVQPAAPAEVVQPPAPAEVVQPAATVEEVADADTIQVNEPLPDCASSPPPCVSVRQGGVQDLQDAAGGEILHPTSPATEIQDAASIEYVQPVAPTTEVQDTAPIEQTLPSRAFERYFGQVLGLPDGQIFDVVEFCLRKGDHPVPVEEYLVSDTCLPADFPYRPVVKWTKAGLRAMDPLGACSAPIEGVPFVADFRDSCDTHDLGYDVLRFFKRAGGERRAVDALFGRDLMADCEKRVRASSDPVAGN